MQPQLQQQQHGIQSAATAAVMQLHQSGLRSAAAAAAAGGGQGSIKDAVAGRLGVWMQQLQEQFIEVQQLLQQLQ
jgi:hypothetical protein